MSFHPFVIRRGAICIPELVFDPELARGVARNFGNRRLYAISCGT